MHEIFRLYRVTKEGPITLMAVSVTVAMALAVCFSNVRASGDVRSMSTFKHVNKVQSHKSIVDISRKNKKRSMTHARCVRWPFGYFKYSPFGLVAYMRVHSHTSQCQNENFVSSGVVRACTYTYIEAVRKAQYFTCVPSTWQT